MVTISDISFVLSEFFIPENLPHVASVNSIMLKSNESSENQWNRVKFGDRQLEFKRLTSTLREIFEKIMKSLYKYNSSHNFEADLAKNIKYVLPWNATSDWQIFEAIIFRLLRNTVNFGSDSIEVQLRFVSLEEKNFIQLSLPDLFKNEDHQAPNENFTNVTGYLITRIKI